MRLPIKDILFVGTQFVLFFLYLFDLIDAIEFPNQVKKGGLIIGILGAGIVLLALLQLNKSLSPFPTPKSDSELRTTGLYALVRHPIYTGIVLLTLGYGLFMVSPWKMLVGIALLVLFHFKSKYEESLLIEKFSGYVDYKKKTGRLLPKIRQ